MKIASQKGRIAFSLVEVTLALAVVSFCLLTMVALLPIALGSMKTSRDEAVATNCMEQIAGAIQRASLQSSGPNSGKYQASGPYNALVWPLAGSTVNFDMTNLSTSGFPSAETSEKHFVARVQITPPANAFTTGTAFISVGWPVQAVWNTTTSNWKNAQGSTRTFLIFLPNS